jgi:hypothetical protein
MPKFVHIPEEVLAALLREAGHPESVEQYLAATGAQAGAVRHERLVRRARAAYWSRFWLTLSAAVTWLGVAGGPDVEGLIAGVLLTGMTVVEFRVYRFFTEGDARGAIYGWWNQCLFAALFLIYGGYHGTFVTIPPMASEAMTYLNAGGDGGGADVLPNVTQLVQFTYYSIGLVGAVGQFTLACYYRAALKSPGR